VPPRRAFSDAGSQNVVNLWGGTGNQHTESSVVQELSGRHPGRTRRARRGASWP